MLWSRFFWVSIEFYWYNSEEWEDNRDDEYIVGFGIPQFGIFGGMPGNWTRQQYNSVSFLQPPHDHILHQSAEWYLLPDRCQVSSMFERRFGDSGYGLCGPRLCGHPDRSQLGCGISAVFRRTVDETIFADMVDTATTWDVWGWRDVMLIWCDMM